VITGPAGYKDCGLVLFWLDLESCLRKDLICRFIYSRSHAPL